jgi:hypothetical protein
MHWNAVPRILKEVHRGRRGKRENLFFSELTLSRKHKTGADHGLFERYGI